MIRRTATYMSLLLLIVVSVLPAVLARADEAKAAPAKEADDQQQTADATQADMLNGQLLAPKAFRAAAEKVLPSVVTIESFGGVTSTSRKGTIGGIRKPGEGPTTGLIISPDGYIITSSFNFIRKQPIITVVLRDGTRHVAKMLGRDDARKICVLKIEGAEDLPTPEMAPRDQLRVGQWAISVGVGFGDQDPALSAGIISARDRISGRAQQTDANVSPANYGGPLIDIEGRVIGICVPLNPKSQDVGSGVEWYDSGIGFAVPLQGNDKILTALKEGRNIKPAYLGIQPKEVDGGVEVAALTDDSAAAKGGVEKGDVIVAVDGQKVANMAALRAQLSRHYAGDKVEVLVKRKDMDVKCDVTLGEPPAPKEEEGPKLPFKLPIPKRD